MPESQLSVTARTETGTSASRRMRRQGNIPAVVYGNKATPVHITITPTDLEAAISGGIFTVLNLEGAPEVKGKTVMIREVQRHPLKRNILHIDFLEIVKGQKLFFTVPISLSGKAKGVMSGGILNVIKHAIALTCLPSEVPNSFVVDITELEIGDSLKLKDLDLPASAELSDDPEDSFLEVKKRTITQEELDEDAAAEALAEGEGEDAVEGDDSAAKKDEGSSGDQGKE
jgi:large subunit ribosomal protein L25